MCNGAQELPALEFSYGSIALQLCSPDPSAGAELLVLWGFRMTT